MKKSVLVFLYLICFSQLLFSYGGVEWSVLNESLVNQTKSKKYDTSLEIAKEAFREALKRVSNKTNTPFYKILKKPYKNNNVLYSLAFTKLVELETKVMNIENETTMSKESDKKDEKKDKKKKNTTKKKEKSYNELGSDQGFAKLTKILNLENSFDRESLVNVKKLLFYTEPSYEDNALVISVINLADLYYINDELKKAESLYLAAFLLKEEMVGYADDELLRILNALGNSYYKTKEYGKSEKFYNAMLMAMETSGRWDTPKVMAVLNNLAVIKLHKGQYLVAEELYKYILNMNNLNKKQRLYVLNNLLKLYSQLNETKKMDNIKREIKKLKRK